MKALAIAATGMNAQQTNLEVIANNIANSDTPHFKRSFVNFESQLKRALDSEKIKRFRNLMTHPKHIAFQRPMDYRQVKPRRVWDYLTTSKNNGNNVDIEQETMNLLQNQLLYQTLAQSVISEFNRVNLVLR